MKNIKIKDKNNRFSLKFTIGSEAITAGVLLETVFLKILQNSQACASAHIRIAHEK